MDLSELLLKHFVQSIVHLMKHPLYWINQTETLPPQSPAPRSRHIHTSPYPCLLHFSYRMR